MLDEALASGASLAAVEEGSFEDLSREAYEELVEEFEVVLKPERDEVMLSGDCCNRCNRTCCNRCNRCNS